MAQCVEVFTGKSDGQGSRATLQDRFLVQEIGAQNIPLQRKKVIVKRRISLPPEPQFFVVKREHWSLLHRRTCKDSVKEWLLNQCR